MALAKYVPPRYFDINIKIILRNFYTIKKLIIFQINLYIKLEKFEQIRHWSDNKGYLKLLIVKVDKQLITKIITTCFSKILNRFKEI